ncbi:hypothetical protein ACFYZJ_28480 [Streptomyces sp. NPDC001848]|uniref:hypothetical protein n=1 Tax=Streptomyces sp. NPDC001848 TaxID=3364618 RepID=UPI003679689D
MASAHLLIIEDRAALSWVVTGQRMAFPTGRAKAARALGEGDEVFLYTTRGCFRNPTRDLGRVIGRATIAVPCASWTSRSSSTSAPTPRVAA